MDSNTYDVATAIIKFETDEMTSTEEVIELFQHLVDTGMAWSLQGHYGRTASVLIETGRITAKEAN